MSSAPDNDHNFGDRYFFSAVAIVAGCYLVITGHGSAVRSLEGPRARIAGGALFLAGLGILAVTIYEDFKCREREKSARDSKDNKS